MNEPLELTLEEESYLIPLLERYNQPGQSVAHRRTLPYFVGRLHKLLADIDGDYLLDAYDYTNDVSVREILERLHEECHEVLKAKIAQALEEFDARFQELTIEVDYPTLGRPPMQWWWYRVPRVARHRSFHDGTLRRRAILVTKRSPPASSGVPSSAPRRVHDG